MNDTNPTKPHPPIEYSRFPAFEIRLPVDWAADPFDNRQWIHNFFTLRWLATTNPFEAVRTDTEALRQSLEILEDYIRHHSNAETEKSLYYTTRLGDLAAGIRMPILTEFFLFLRAHPEWVSNALDQKLLLQIQSELELMLSEAFYEKKSNHLVGLDTGALHALLLIPETDPDGSRAGFCERRLINMLAGIFDKEGVVLEHSVHYQAYNAWLCTQLLDLYDRVERKTEIFDRVCQIVDATRRILPFAIKPNGEYHLIGDTFQRPLVRYLKTFTEYSRRYLPGSVPEGESRLDQQDFPHHAMFAPDAGFASVRFQWAQNKRMRTFHLYQTSGWHSNIHKQGDELSFSLYSGGGDLIVDPGYTDLESSVEADHESPWRHNTIVSPALQWTHRKMAKPTGGGMTGWHVEPGLAAVRTEMHRLPGVRPVRILVFIQPNFLCVLDHIKSETEHPFEQRFTFAPGAEITESDRGGFDIQREGMQSMSWVPQGRVLPDYKMFDNYVIRDKGFRSEGAELAPARGIAFLGHGTDLRMHHLLCPAGRQHWDFGSFEAQVDRDDVEIRFTWNMIRFHHAFRLQSFSEEDGFCIHEI